MINYYSLVMNFKNRKAFPSLHNWREKGNFNALFHNAFYLAVYTIVCHYCSQAQAPQMFLRISIWGVFFVVYLLLLSFRGLCLGLLLPMCFSWRNYKIDKNSENNGRLPGRTWDWGGMQMMIIGYLK